MKVYIKQRSDFKTVLLGNAESWTVPVASASSENGQAVLAEYDKKEHTGDWLYIFGQIVLISQAAPQNNKLQVSLTDPINAFDRQAVWPDAPGTTYGAFIKSAIERDYINCTDPAYRITYLNVENTDFTPLITPELDDTKLYRLSELMAQARRAGVMIDFLVIENALRVLISTGGGAEHRVFFNDGHAQLSSETYSSNSIAKVSVMQEVEQEDKEAPIVYDITDYYLSVSGEISTTVPAERAQGRWEHVVIKAEDDPHTKAVEAFSANIASHKIEFYSDREYRLFDNVLLRLNGSVFKSQIVYIGRDSKDDRIHYKCGELAVTLTEKVRSMSGGGVTYNTTIGGGGVTIPVPIEQGGTGQITAAAALAALGGASIVKLWENASPSSAFAAQTVTVAPGYSMLVVIFKRNSSDDAHYSIVIPAGIKDFSLTEEISSAVCARGVSENSNVTGRVTFSNGYRNGSVSNAVLIPRTIFGLT